MLFAAELNKSVQVGANRGKPRHVGGHGNVCFLCCLLFCWVSRDKSVQLEPSRGQYAANKNVGHIIFAAGLDESAKFVATHDRYG